jgi:nucleoside-triphosphatase THEP1
MTNKDNKHKKSKYNKNYLESRKMVSFMLDKKTDKDIIDWLGKQENQSRSIREALRDIAWKEKKND